MFFVTIFAAFIFVASLSRASAVPTCADNQPTTFYPHEDCSKFYVCTAGTLQVLSCASGLYYDSANQICNYADSVACKNSLPICLDNGSETFFPHEDCTKYYECSNGVLSVFTCPSGLYYDSGSQFCDYLPKGTSC